LLRIAAHPASHRHGHGIFEDLSELAFLEHDSVIEVLELGF
jgi:hypothetical protein